jgi:hypothetical protein
MTVINLAIRTAVLACTLLAGASTAYAQRVLDLPVRTGVGADALASGPVGIFWNPGSIGLPAGRGEALVLDARGPAPTGLDGLGVAGVYRLNNRTALGFGFQYAGIDEIQRTTTSPLPADGAVPLDVSEIAFSLAALRQAGVGSSIGLVLRYTRVSEAAGGDDVVSIGAGFRHSIAAVEAIEPVLGAAVTVDGDGAEWVAGASLERPIGTAGAWAAGAEYGVRGSPRFSGIGHRIALTGLVAARLRVGLGVAVEPGADGSTVEPAGSASLSIGRYIVGIVREELPNDFGAVHQFRFSVAF